MNDSKGHILGEENNFEEERKCRKQILSEDPANGGIPAEFYTNTHLANFKGMVKVANM